MIRRYRVQGLDNFRRKEEIIYEQERAQEMAVEVEAPIGIIKYEVLEITK